MWPKGLQEGPRMWFRGSFLPFMLKGGGWALRLHPNQDSLLILVSRAFPVFGRRKQPAGRGANTHVPAGLERGQAQRAVPPTETRELWWVRQMRRTQEMKGRAQSPEPSTWASQGPQGKEVKEAGSWLWGKAGNSFRENPQQSRKAPEGISPGPGPLESTLAGWWHLSPGGL